MSQSAPVVLIGSSTGGPGALKIVLEQLPKKFKGIVILVQHIHQQFLPGLAQWLSSTTGHSVVIPKSGDIPREGIVYLAGAGGNLGITNLGTFVYSAPSPTQVYVPSIDTVFRECSRTCGQGAAAILTGMGDDGAQALHELKSKGWRTLVQEPATCVVDGMPSVALKTDSRHEILILEKLGQVVRTFCDLY